MNAITPIARFPGTTLAEDRAAMAHDLPAAVYAEQQDAEAALQSLTDELSYVLWADGRTSATHGDVQDMRDVAVAMRSAKLAFAATMHERAAARRAAR